MREKVAVLAVIFLLIAGLTFGLYRTGDSSYNSDYRPPADFDGYEDLNMDKVRYNPPSEELESTIDGNNEFAFSLYHNLSSDENLFYSPWSITSALALTYEGARGQTAEEIRDVFGYPENRSNMRKSYGYLHNKYNTNKSSYKINTANSAWIQEEFGVLEEYKFILMNYYFSEVDNVDFAAHPQRACDRINDWIEDNTDGKIKKLITKQDVNSLTKFVLANAIHFNGLWEKPFNETDTYDGTFQTPGGDVTASFMLQNGTFNYTSTSDLKVLQKKYIGERASMLFVMPKDEDLNDISGSLTYENLERWRGNLTETSMEKVEIPKFNLSAKYDLTETLQSMGMPTAFTGGANFEGIDGRRDLFIQFVKHKAFVEVNEKGTEAAAATVVGVGKTGIGQKPTFIADHPFLFIIQDDETGNILFMGRVNEPST